MNYDSFFLAFLSKEYNVQMFNASTEEKEGPTGTPSNRVVSEQKQKNGIQRGSWTTKTLNSPNKVAVS
jgi:hypothetical protein